MIRCRRALRLYTESSELPLSGSPNHEVMQTIEITPEETEVLHEQLENSLKELDVELRRADSIAFKQMLKERRETLLHLLDKVAAIPVAT